MHEKVSPNQQSETNAMHFIFNLLRINPLTPELNPFAQRCLTRFFTGDFAF
jgi:hypothetical protein